MEYYQLAHNERHPVTKKPDIKLMRTSAGPMNWSDQLIRFCRSMPRVCNAEIIDRLSEQCGNNSA